MFSLSMVTAIVCSLFVGAVATLWTQIPWALTQRNFTSEPSARRWQIGFGLSMVVMFPWLGAMMIGDEAGKSVQVVMFIDILAVTLSLAWLGQHQSLRSGLLAVLLFSLAIPGIILPTFVMLPQALGFSPVFALNVGFVGVSLGALLSPYLFKLVWKRFNFRHGFLILALACLLPALLVAITDAENFSPPPPPPPVPAKQDQKDQKPLAKNAKHVPAEAPVPDSPPRDSHWWVLMMLAFVMAPLEALSLIWRKGFLAQHDAANRLTRPGFWIAYLGMCLFAGWIIRDGYAAWWLLGLAGVHAMILGHLAGDYGHRGSTFGFWLAGATFAPITPTLLAVPFIFYSNFQETAVLGWVLGVMALSQCLWALLVERIVEKWSTPAVLHLALMLILVFAALALTLALMHSELYGNPTRIRRPHRWPWRTHAAVQLIGVEYPSCFGAAT